VLSISIMLNCCWILIFGILLLNLKLWRIGVQLWIMIGCCWIMSELIVGEKLAVVELYCCWNSENLCLVPSNMFQKTDHVLIPDSCSGSNSWSSSKWSSRQIKFYLSISGDWKLWPDGSFFFFWHFEVLVSNQRCLKSIFGISRFLKN